MLAEAIEKVSLVEISLRSRKSYIGFVSESGVGIGGDTDVILVPVWSGFRDRYTQDLEIITDYNPILDEYVDSESPQLSYEDFRIVIPIAEIVSARFFLPAVYVQFQGESHKEELGEGEIDEED